MIGHIYRVEKDVGGMEDGNPSLQDGVPQPFNEQALPFSEPQTRIGSFHSSSRECVLHFFFVIVASHKAPHSRVCFFES